MPKHSLVKCLLHIVWGTKNRFPYFKNKVNSKKCYEIIKQICIEKDIYVKELFVNAEHVHILLFLPVNLTVKDLMQTLKGKSSFEINNENIFTKQFKWARGYAAFSVSLSASEIVAKYIRNQEKHHRHKNYEKEWSEFEKENKQSDVPS